MLVHGKTPEEYNERLYRILRRLKKEGLTLNRDKCRFSERQVPFLGQIVDESGIRPDPDKLDAISNVLVPVNVGDIRRFLGTVNQMTKFALNLADITKSLRDLLVKEQPLVWGEPQQRLFNQIKAKLTTSPVLALFDPNLQTVVLTCCLHIALNDDDRTKVCSN